MPFISSLRGSFGPQGRFGRSVDLAASTGGTITISGNYRYHTFMSVGNGTFVASAPGTLEVLVVAGGGGGRSGNANGNGGGGAGGLVYHSAKSISAGSYTVTVGSGGAHGGNNGQNSTFDNITAIGGGGGGNSGGSGGGGYAQGNPGVGCAGPQGSATQGNSGGGIGYGNNGGNRHENHYLWAGGGGGGAGGVGGNNVHCSPSTNPASYGGIGRTYSQFANLIYSGHDGGFAGGGSGAHENYGSNPGYQDTPSIGFGGGATSGNGTANTGGGGGGTSGSGGSGVVIIRYQI